MIPIEGFFIKTKDDLMFAVKGVHQPKGRMICSLRYVPSENGDRGRYKKVLPHEGFFFLKKNYPEYIVFDKTLGRKIQSIPYEKVKQIYNPVSKLRYFRDDNNSGSLGALSVSLASEVKRITNISWKDIGVTGSILVNLHSRESDIDLIVFGEKAGRKVYENMPKIFGNNARPYTGNSLRYLYNVRGKPMGLSFNEFIKLESRKKLQGTFMGKDFQIRLVKRQSELGSRFGDIKYKTLENVEATATVVDVRDAIFTPCIYPVDNVQIVSGKKSLSHVTSYMGRFCENALKGESIKIIGNLERGSDGTSRVIVGNNPCDRLMPENFT